MAQEGVTQHLSGKQMDPSPSQLLDPQAMSEEDSSRAKPIHTLILDSTPLLVNTPPLSTLRAQSTYLTTTPSVISEIRDQEAKARVETLYLPFLTLRSPKPESITVVREFAKKTGDTAVLSKTDLEILGLAYELECERNGGDWRLRRLPGQKRLNGSPPKKEDFAHDRPKSGGEGHAAEAVPGAGAMSPMLEKLDLESSGRESSTAGTGLAQHGADQITWEPDTASLSPEPSMEIVDEGPSSDSDSDGWITPSNIKKYQARYDPAATSTKTEVKTMQVATVTGDFAMQNVLLQMNLNLLSPATCKRISRMKQTILRCHGCFATTKDMTKQFCPRCGNPTLTRVTCSTNDQGEVKLHLKAKMQWNNTGNVFSIPKPIGGSANQKWKGPRQGGGQSGWGSGLILAEDQKEYARAVSSHRRAAQKDLMDDDVLPNILTGARDRGGGRIKVGAGRNVNSRKR